MNKFYADTGSGQLHARRLDAHGDVIHRPLLCLHPAPTSGLYFTTVMPLLNQGRTVIAPDYPGYGGSDPIGDSPTLADYAKSVLELLDGASISQPVDILGFHTGCLVGVEMAHQRSASVRRLVLCDIPYFTAEQQAGFREKMVRPLPLTSELESLADAWRFSVSGRLEDVTLDRAFELFVEHLRAGRQDALAFAAAFSYDCESRFAGLDADTVCLATRSGLHDATVAAAAAIPDARFVDVPEVTSAVFEAGAEAISGHILDSL